jgi:hypothetical protein
MSDTEKYKYFPGLGDFVIQRFYETGKIIPWFYFPGFLRFLCDTALIGVEKEKMGVREIRIYFLIHAHLAMDSFYYLKLLRTKEGR